MILVQSKLTISSEIILLLAIPPCSKNTKEHTEDNEDNDDVT